MPLDGSSLINILSGHAPFCTTELVGITKGECGEKFDEEVCGAMGGAIVVVFPETSKLNGCILSACIEYSHEVFAWVFDVADSPKF